MLLEVAKREFPNTRGECVMRLPSALYCDVAHALGNVDIQQTHAQCLVFCLHSTRPASTLMGLMFVGGRVVANLMHGAICSLSKTKMANQ